jgi:hypothetical protein
MAGYSVQVEGLKELQRALKKADGDLDSDVKDELKRLGQMVVEDATGRGARYTGIGPYKPIVKQKEVLIRQSKGKVTGQRGDFGSLQMRNVLEPALDAKSGDVERGLENMLEKLLARADLT